MEEEGLEISLGIGEPIVSKLGTDTGISDNLTNTIVIRAGSENQVHIAYLEPCQTHEVGF